MPLNSKFTKFTTASPQLVSVDFVDKATGVGLITFYAGHTDTDGYILSSNAFYSSEASTASGQNVAMDLDFDVLIEKTLIIDGTCIVEIPYILAHDAGSWSSDPNVVVTLRHWDGTTETDLGTATGNKPLVSIGANISKDVLNTVKFDVTRKTFKKGDTLRLTIATAAAGAGTEFILAHDPLGRTNEEATQVVGIDFRGSLSSAIGTWTLTTILKAQIPIVII